MRRLIAIVPEEEGVALYIDSPAGLLPAGTRLFRGGLQPRIQFRHSDPAEAVSDCRTLQRYLDKHQTSEG